MKCKNFRLKIGIDGDDNKNLELHLKNCKKCTEWLKGQISSPPKGLSKNQWETITKKLSGEYKNTSTINSSEASQLRDSDKKNTVDSKSEKEPEKFWNFFFNGMTYGLVFGLAAVTGLAILSVYEAAEKKQKYKTGRPFSLQKFYEQCYGKRNYHEIRKHFLNYPISRTLDFIDYDLSHRYDLIKLK